MTELRNLGHLTFYLEGSKRRLFETGEEKKVQVTCVTPRCPNPSLDVFWSLAGVHVLRLHPMRLFVVPPKRVRAKIRTQWVCIEPGLAWAIWWKHCFIEDLRERQRRCPPRFWPEELVEKKGVNP